MVTIQESPTRKVEAPRTLRAARRTTLLRALGREWALAVRWDVVLGTVALVLAPFAGLYVHALSAQSPGGIPPWPCWAFAGVASALVVLCIVAGHRWRARIRRHHVRLIESVTQSLSEGVVLVDASGRMVFSSLPARGLLGDPPSGDDVVAWLEQTGLRPPAVRRGVVAPEHILRRALDGDVVAEELWARPTTGARPLLWLSLSARPIRDAHGDLDGAVLVLRDVTRRVCTADSNRRLAIAVEQTADMVMITDCSGRIEYVNPAFRALTGYEPSEALGRTPALLKSGVHAEPYFARLWRTILAGQVFRGTIVNRRKDGSTYAAEQTISPLVDGGGEVTHFVSVSKDMTEHARLQRREIELELGASMQRRLYPDAPPPTPGLDVAGRAWPAEETCGDLYDLLPRPDGALLLVVGDVSGHGVGPALLMSEARAYLRSMAGLPLSLTEILARMNALLKPDLADDAFVTLLLVEVARATHRIRWASAGHVEGLLLGPRGEIRTRLLRTGPALGPQESPAFELMEGPVLLAGEVLLLATDGVTESPRADGEPLDEDGLVALAADLLDRPTAHILDELQRRLVNLHAGQPARDDITLVAVKLATDAPPTPGSALAVVRPEFAALVPARGA